MGWTLTCQPLIKQIAPHDILTDMTTSQSDEYNSPTVVPGFKLNIVCVKLNNSNHNNKNNNNKIANQNSARVVLGTWMHVWGSEDGLTYQVFSSVVHAV